MLWRSFPHSASTRTPQPNKRQSVGAGRVGAIRRDHAARQCSAAHLGRVAALCTPCSLSGRLFTRCSSDLAVQLNKRTRRTNNACSITRTALLVHGSAGMISAGSRRGSSHALVPWNREQAWSASGPSGGHAFSGRTDSKGGYRPDKVLCKLWMGTFTYPTDLYHGKDMMESPRSGHSRRTNPRTHACGLRLERERELFLESF